MIKRLLLMGLLSLLGCVTAYAQDRYSPAELRRSPMCRRAVQVEPWLVVQQALGIFAAERFGSPDDSEARARDLVNSWRLLRIVDLPGIGNAADYVDKQISSTAYDARLGASTNAQYISGRDTLMLGPAFFESAHASDFERAASLLHEARHAADARYRHVLCGTNSAMAWMPMCDQRFVAAPGDEKAGPWSLEVVFLSLLRATDLCLNGDQLQRQINGRLENVFRIVGSDQRKALRDLISARSPRDERDRFDKPRQLRPGDLN
jgi:hypothetical protein